MICCLILELGTNDLSVQAPETAESETDDLVHLFRDKYKIRVVCVYQVNNRNFPQTQVPDHDFNDEAALLRQYLSVVLAEEHGIFFMRASGFFPS